MNDRPEQITRVCGCGAVVQVSDLWICMCKCHAGLSEQSLVDELTTIHEYPWGRIEAVHYDYRLNAEANFSCQDGGYVVYLWVMGTYAERFHVTTEAYQGYMERLVALGPQLQTIGLEIDATSEHLEAARSLLSNVAKPLGEETWGQERKE